MPTHDRTRPIVECSSADKVILTSGNTTISFTPEAALETAIEMINAAFALSRPSLIPVIGTIGGPAPDPLANASANAS
jgi:hypothetical protein